MTFSIVFYIKGVVVVIAIENIHSLDDWKKTLSRKELHWKEGRSAYELANYFIGANGGLPDRIAEVLSAQNLPVLDFICYPEYKTRFDDCRGEPRNHDMLMVSTDNSLVIGVEAKVDEMLGKTIAQEWETAGDNKKKRIRGLTRRLFDREPTDGYMENLRYQLLTATAGTLAEAKKRNIKKALLLVLVFKKDGCYIAKRIEKNNRDFFQYVELLGKPPEYHLPGYADVDFYVDYREVAVL